MVDVHSPEQRSFNMSQIRSKNTRPEMIVRKWLWTNGYRYRLHRNDLPGKPDIVLSKYHTVIFIHGCFWHRHGCQYTTFPSSRKEFWQKKFESNIQRDITNQKNLEKAGWNVLILWECEIKNSEKFKEVIKSFQALVQ